MVPTRITGSFAGVCGMHSDIEIIAIAIVEAVVGTRPHVSLVGAPHVSALPMCQYAIHFCALAHMLNPLHSDSIAYKHAWILGSS